MRATTHLKKKKKMVLPANIFDFSKYAWQIKEDLKHQISEQKDEVFIPRWGLAQSPLGCAKFEGVNQRSEAVTRKPWI